MRVLNVTSHLGAGLGSVINAYIKSSKLNHDILELEKTKNPCDINENQYVQTLRSTDNILDIASKYEICLIHYYCCPNIVSSILNLNSLTGTKLVTWCHNNGNSIIQPLSKSLLCLVDEVVLSGCKKESFINSSVVRPIPLVETINTINNNFETVSYELKKINFRYIGSLSGTKLHKDSHEWFNYLKSNYQFDISTLDTEHDFQNFNVKIGEINREILYEKPFCAVYPLRNDHYGCGELGLQELLMLGYPVILCNNLVEIEITQGLLGVYFANNINELAKICDIINSSWSTIIKKWKYRSDFNIKVIKSKKPYENLDKIIENSIQIKNKRSLYTKSMGEIEIMKLAYDQSTDDGLNKILNDWKISGHSDIASKGSPAHFSQFFNRNLLKGIN